MLTYVLLPYPEEKIHYTDVIMGAMASQITSLKIVYSTVYSDQRKHQSSASLAFVRWPVDSLHKWPVTRKMFPFDDVIMNKTRPNRRLSIEGQQWEKIVSYDFILMEYGGYTTSITHPLYVMILISNNWIVFFSKWNFVFLLCSLWIWHCGLKLVQL